MDLSCYNRTTMLSYVRGLGKALDQSLSYVLPSLLAKRVYIRRQIILSLSLCHARFPPFFLKEYRLDVRYSLSVMRASLPSCEKSLY
jgi:hypothetical protein